MSVINTNLNALVSQESSRASNLKLSRSMERLSTGSRATRVAQTRKTGQKK